MQIHTLSIQIRIQNDLKDLNWILYVQEGMYKFHELLVMNMDSTYSTASSSNLNTDTTSEDNKFMYVHIPRDHVSGHEK